MPRSHWIRPVIRTHLLTCVDPPDLSVYHLCASVCYFSVHQTVRQRFEQASRTRSIIIIVFLLFIILPLVIVIILIIIIVCSYS